jgi:flagellar protein FliS
MILVELSNSVDCEKAGEIGKRIVGLYDYMLNRLVEAHVEQQDAPLAEISRLLTILQEGWIDVEVSAAAVPMLAAR